MSKVKVAVRVRPPTQRELELGSRIAVQLHEDSRTGSANVLTVHNAKLESQAELVDSRERTKTFCFDYVYMSVDPLSENYASQEVIFEELGTEVLQAAEDGYNSCVFAYGQTGTGKTHTMMGQQNELGLIPRICEGLFSRKFELEEESDELRFNITVSFYEIYNERVRDLLVPPQSSQSQRYKLKIRENPNTGPYVEGLLQQTVKNNRHVQTCIDKGIRNRTTASTHMHERSSRSHAIFTILFEQAKIDDYDPKERKSKIHLVDLAGSERADPTTKYDKNRQKEGANINKSLVTLGNVISALAERSLIAWSKPEEDINLSTASIELHDPACTSTPRKQRQLYIPYRDSVLTWLLKDSLGGNSKTIMIATVCPTSLYYNETISTLRYAQRAKCIVNQPEINEDPNVQLIRELKAEIVRLRSLLDARWDDIPPGLDKVSNSFKSIEIQAGSIMSMSETSSVLAERLEENETKVRDLTQNFLGRWKESHDWMKDSDMSIQPLRLSGRSQSMGVIVDSVLPHLVGMSEDILQTGIMLYYLKEGTTMIGTEDAAEEPDSIVLEGPEILPEHCWITNNNGEVIIHPQHGATVTINSKPITKPEKLTQGDIVHIGGIKFRFNNPQEAAKLRERRRSVNVAESRLLSSMSRCSSYSSINTSSGIDMESPSPTPATSLFRGPSWNDFCLEMERKYATERERIEMARQELEHLRDEHRREEELRQEKEENMWRLHEEHLAEIEAEWKRLALQKEAQTQEQANAMRELEEARKRIEQERHQNEEKIQEQLQQLRKLESSPNRSSRELAIQTVPDLGELAVQTESQLASALMGRRTTESQTGSCQADLQDVMGHVKKLVQESQMTIQGQKKVLIEHELLSKYSIIQREKEIQAKAKQIEEMFLASSERLELESRRLEEKAAEYRKEDASTLEIITHHTQNVEKIEHKETQLELYIEEKQREIEEGAGELIAGSFSEEMLSTPTDTDSWFSSKESQSRCTPTASSVDSAFLSEHSIPQGGARPKSGTASGSVSRNKATSKRAKDITDRLYPGPPKRMDDKQTSRGTPASTAKQKIHGSSCAPTRSTGKGQSGKRTKGNAAHVNVLSGSSQADIPMTIEESPEVDALKTASGHQKAEGLGACDIRLRSPRDSAYVSPMSTTDSIFSEKLKTGMDDTFDEVTNVTRMDSISSADTLVPVEPDNSVKESGPLPVDAAFHIESNIANEGTSKMQKPKPLTDIMDMPPKRLPHTAKQQPRAAICAQKTAMKTTQKSEMVDTLEKKNRSESRESLKSAKSDGAEAAATCEREAQLRSRSEPPKTTHVEHQQIRPRSVSHTSHTISSKAKTESQGSSRRSSLSSVKSEKSTSGAEHTTPKHKQTKVGAKRTRTGKGKDLPKSSDAFLSKPKKSKRGDFHLEIYIPSGSVGGGGGTSLPIGSGSASADDPFRSSTDPTHDVFARSLRSGSVGSDRSQGSLSGSVQEEVCGFLESGTKIIRRQRLPPTEQEIEEELKKQNRTAQIFIPHKLQDGRTQTLDLTEESDISEASLCNTSSQSHTDSKTISSAKIYSDDSLEHVSQEASVLPEHESLGCSQKTRGEQPAIGHGFSDDSLEGICEDELNQVTRSTSDISTKTVIEREQENSFNVDVESRIAMTSHQQQDPFGDQLNLSLPMDEKRSLLPQISPRTAQKRVKKKRRDAKSRSGPGTESDVMMSDDSLMSSPSKSSRPNSGSRRRRKKHHSSAAVIGLSSEEYASSEGGSSSVGSHLSSDERIPEECRQELLAAQDRDAEMTEQQPEDVDSLTEMDCSKNIALAHRRELEQMVRASGVRSDGVHDSMWKGGRAVADGASVSPATSQDITPFQKKLAQFSQTAVDVWFTSSLKEEHEDVCINMSIISGGERKQFSLTADELQSSKEARLPVTCLCSGDVTMAASDGNTEAEHSRSKPDWITQTEKPNLKLKVTPVDSWQSPFLSSSSLSSSSSSMSTSSSASLSSSETPHHSTAVRQQPSQLSLQTLPHQTEQDDLLRSSDNEVTSPWISITFRQGSRVQNMGLAPHWDLGGQLTFPAADQQQMDPTTGTAYPSSPDLDDLSAGQTKSSVDSSVSPAHIIEDVTRQQTADAAATAAGGGGVCQLDAAAVTAEQFSRSSHISSDSLDTRKDYVSKSNSGPDQLSRQSGQSFESDSLECNVLENMETGGLTPSSTSDVLPTESFEVAGDTQSYMDVELGSDDSHKPVTEGIRMFTDAEMPDVPLTSDKDSPDEGYPPIDISGKQQQQKHQQQQRQLDHRAVDLAQHQCDDIEIRIQGKRGAGKQRIEMANPPDSENTVSKAGFSSEITTTSFPDTSSSCHGDTAVTYSASHIADIADGHITETGNTVADPGQKGVTTEYQQLEDQGKDDVASGLTMDNQIPNALSSVNVKHRPSDSIPSLPKADAACEIISNICAPELKIKERPEEVSADVETPLEQNLSVMVKLPSDLYMMNVAEPASDDSVQQHVSEEHLESTPSDTTEASAKPSSEQLVINHTGAESALGDMMIGIDMNPEQKDVDMADISSSSFTADVAKLNSSAAPSDLDKESHLEQGLHSASESFNSVMSQGTGLCQILKGESVSSRGIVTSRELSLLLEKPVTDVPMDLLSTEEKKGLQTIAELGAVHEYQTAGSGIPAAEDQSKIDVKNKLAEVITDVKTQKNFPRIVVDPQCEFITVQYVTENGEVKQAMVEKRAHRSDNVHVLPVTDASPGDSPTSPHRDSGCYSMYSTGRDQGTTEEEDNLTWSDRACSEGGSLGFSQSKGSRSSWTSGAEQSAPVRRDVTQDPSLMELPTSLVSDVTQDLTLLEQPTPMERHIVQEPLRMELTASLPRDATRDLTGIDTLQVCVEDTVQEPIGLEQTGSLITGTGEEHAITETEVICDNGASQQTAVTKQPMSAQNSSEVECHQSSVRSTPEKLTVAEHTAPLVMDTTQELSARKQIDSLIMDTSQWPAAAGQAVMSTGQTPVESAQAGSVAVDETDELVTAEKCVSAMDVQREHLTEVAGIALLQFGEMQQTAVVTETALQGAGQMQESSVIEQPTITEQAASPVIEETHQTTAMEQDTAQVVHQICQPALVETIALEAASQTMEPADTALLQPVTVERIPSYVMDQRQEPTVMAHSASLPMDQILQADVVKQIASPVSGEIITQQTESLVTDALEQPMLTEQTEAFVMDQTQNTLVTEETGSQVMSQAVVERTTSLVMDQAQEPTQMEHATSPMIEQLQVVGQTSSLVKDWTDQQPQPVQTGTLVMGQTGEPREIEHTTLVMEQPSSVATEQTASHAVIQKGQPMVTEQTVSLVTDQSENVAVLEDITLEVMNEAQEPVVMEQTSSQVMDQGLMLTPAGAVGELSVSLSSLEPASGTASSEVRATVGTIDHVQSMAASGEQLTSQNEGQQTEQEVTSSGPEVAEIRNFEDYLLSMLPDKAPQHHHTVSNRCQSNKGSDKSLVAVPASSVHVTSPLAQTQMVGEEDVKCVQTDVQDVSADIVDDCTDLIDVPDGILMEKMEKPIAADVESKAATAEGKFNVNEGLLTKRDEPSDSCHDTAGQEHSTYVFGEQPMPFTEHVQDFSAHRVVLQTVIGEEAGAVDPLSTQPELTQQYSASDSSVQLTDPQILPSQHKVIIDVESADVCPKTDAEVCLFSEANIQPPTGVTAAPSTVAGDQEKVKAGSPSEMIVDVSQTDNVERQMLSDSVFLNVYEMSQEDGELIESPSGMRSHDTVHEYSLDSERDGERIQEVVEVMSDSNLPTEDESIERVFKCGRYDDDIDQHYDPQEAAAKRGETNVADRKTEGRSHTFSDTDQAHKQVTGVLSNVIPSSIESDMSRRTLDHESVQLGQGSEQAKTAGVNQTEILDRPDQVKSPITNSELIYTPALEFSVGTSSQPTECLQRLMENQSGMTDLSVLSDSAQTSWAEHVNNGPAGVEDITGADHDKTSKDVASLTNTVKTDKTEKPASGFGSSPTILDQSTPASVEGECGDRDQVFVDSSTHNLVAQSSDKSDQALVLSTGRLFDGARTSDNRQWQLVIGDGLQSLISHEDGDGGSAVNVERAQSLQLDGLNAPDSGLTAPDHHDKRREINAIDKQTEEVLSKQSDVICSRTELSRLQSAEVQYNRLRGLPITNQGTTNVDSRAVEISEDDAHTTEAHSEAKSHAQSSSGHTTSCLKADATSEDGSISQLSNNSLDLGDEDKGLVCDEDISIHLVSETMDSESAPSVQGVDDWEKHGSVPVASSHQVNQSDGAAACAQNVSEADVTREMSVSTGEAHAADMAAQVPAADAAGRRDEDVGNVSGEDRMQVDVADRETKNMLKRLHASSSNAADKDAIPQAAKQVKLERHEGQGQIPDVDHPLEGATGGSLEGSPVDAFQPESHSSQASTSVNVNISNASLDEGYLTMLHTSLVTQERPDVSASLSTSQSGQSQLTDQEETGSFSDDGSSVDPVPVAQSAITSGRGLEGTLTTGDGKDNTQSDDGQAQHGNVGGNGGNGEQADEDDITDDHPGLITVTGADVGDEETADNSNVEAARRTSASVDKVEDAEAIRNKTKHANVEHSSDREEPADPEQATGSDATDAGSNGEQELSTSLRCINTDDQDQTRANRADTPDDDPGLDLGEYRLVHFKSPEPGGRRLDERRNLQVAELSPSDFIEMSNVVELASVASEQQNGFMTLIGSEERLSGFSNQNIEMTGPRTSTPDMLNIQNAQSRDDPQDASMEREDSTVVMETSSMLRNPDDEDDTVTDGISGTEPITTGVQDEQESEQLSPGSSVDPIVCATPEALDNKREAPRSTQTTGSSSPEVRSSSTSVSPGLDIGSHVQATEALYIDTHHTAQPSSGTVSDSGLDTDWTPTDAENILSPGVRMKNLTGQTAVGGAEAGVMESSQLIDNNANQTAEASPPQDIRSKSSDGSSQSNVVQGASVRTESGKLLETNLVRENDSLTYKVSPGTNGTSKSQVESRLASGGGASDACNQLTIEVLDEKPNGNEMSLELSSPTDKKVRFVDTQTFIMDIKPQDVSKLSEEDNMPDDHEIIFGAQSTVGYSDRRSGVRIAEDYQVFGIQPGGTTKLSYVPGPAQVLRDEPTHPSQSHLLHSSVNIEIKPRGRDRDLAELEYSADEILPLEAGDHDNVEFGQSTSSEHPRHADLLNANTEVASVDRNKTTQTSQRRQIERMANHTITSQVRAENITFPEDTVEAERILLNTDDIHLITDGAENRDEFNWQEQDSTGLFTERKLIQERDIKTVRSDLTVIDEIADAEKSEDMSLPHTNSCRAERITSSTGQMQSDDGKDTQMTSASGNKEEAPIQTNRDGLQLTETAELGGEQSVGNKVSNKLDDQSVGVMEQETRKSGMFGQGDHQAQVKLDVPQDGQLVTDNQDLSTRMMQEDDSNVQEQSADDLSEGEIQEVSMDSGASTDDSLDSAQRMRDVIEQERKAIIGTISSVDELDEMNVSSNSSSIDESEWRDRAIAKVWSVKPRMTASEAFKLAELAHRGKEELDNDKEEWLMRAARAVQAHRARNLQRQLSPGEIFVPEELMPELEPLTNSCEAFAEIADQVEQLPELISQDVHSIRERFLRRPVELQRSLSTSELDYIEVWERHQNVGCQSSSDTNMLAFEYGDRVPSMDSFIYVFLSRARSLDHMTFQDDEDQQERKGTMSRPKSVPLCHKENERLEADQFDLPVREISASLEYLPLPKLTTKQKSSSLGYSGENAHLLDIPPDRIFGGAPDENAIALESLANSPGYGSRLREAQTQTDQVGDNPQASQITGKCVSFGDVMILPDFSFDSEVRSSGSEPTLGNSHGRPRVRSPRTYGVEIGIQTSFEEVQVSYSRFEAETQTLAVSASNAAGPSLLLQQAIETVRQTATPETSEMRDGDVDMELIASEEGGMPVESHGGKRLLDEMSAQKGNETHGQTMSASSVSSDVASLSSSPDSIDKTLLNSIRKAKEILEAAAGFKRSTRKARRMRYHSDDSSSASEDRTPKRKRYTSGGKYQKDQYTFMSLDVFTQTGDSLTNLSRTLSERNLITVQDPTPVVRVEERQVSCLERWSSEYSVFSGAKMDKAKSQSEADIGRTSSGQTRSDFFNRSIETQTYPDQRVIETQTIEDAMIEIRATICSPVGLHSLTTPIMVDTAVGASPPQGSPVLLSPFYDVEGLGFAQASSSLRPSDLSLANESDVSQRVSQQLGVDEAVQSEVDRHLLNIDSTGSEQINEAVASLHHPDLQMLKEEHEKFMETLRKAKENRDKSLEKRKQLKVSRVNAISDVSEAGVTDTQNPPGEVCGDDRKHGDVLLQQDEEDQTEMKETYYGEQSSGILQTETVGHDRSRGQLSLGTCETEVRNSTDNDPLAHTIKAINEVLSSQVARILNDQSLNSDTIMADNFEKHDTSMSTVTCNTEDSVATDTRVRTTDGIINSDVQSSTQQSSIETIQDTHHEETPRPVVCEDLSVEASHDTTGATDKGTEVHLVNNESINSVCSESSLGISTSEDRDTASESSGHTTGSEVTVIEAGLQESSPRICPDDNHQEAESVEGGTSVGEDDTMVSEEVPDISEQFTPESIDHKPEDDPRLTLSVGMGTNITSESVNTTTVTENVNTVHDLHLEDRATDVGCEDVIRSPRITAEHEISPAVQLASCSKDSTVVSGRRVPSHGNFSSELQYSSPPQTATATEFEGQLHPSPQDRQNTRVTTTQYWSNVDESEARNVQYLPVPRAHSSPRTTDPDSDIQVIVEKYQKIKDLIEKGAIDEEEGIPLVTLQNKDMMTSTPNLRAGTDVQIRVSVSAHRPADAVERSQSAPPTPARADISTSTTADSLASPNSTMVDEAVETESVSSEYDDELERLRKERERIVNMLAKDQMPSKLQVELAEAQLNYLIGQTDTLLCALDDPVWDTSSIAAFSAPEEHLSEISRQYLARYRQTLQRSRVQIENRIRQLEKEQREKYRSRQRSRQYLRMKRNIEKEAFLMERQREQVRYRTVVGLPFSKSVSPARGRRPARSSSPDSHSTPPPTPLGADFLRPKERVSYLAEKRRDLVQLTQNVDADRSRSMSPALSVHSSASLLGSQRPVSRGADVDDILSRYDGRRDDEPPYVGFDSFEVDSIASSLDEESYQLLADYRSARGRTQAEIQRAKESLNRRPDTTPKPRSTTPSVRDVSQGLLSLATDFESRIDPDLERKIDREIEELKTHYSKLSAESHGERSQPPLHSRYPRSTSTRQFPISSTPQTSSLYDPLQSNFSERDLLLMTGRQLPYSHGIHDSLRRYDTTTSFMNTPSYPSVLKKTRPINAADIKAQIVRERTLAHLHGKHPF